MKKIIFIFLLFIFSVNAYAWEIKRILLLRTYPSWQNAAPDYVCKGGQIQKNCNNLITGMTFSTSVEACSYATNTLGSSCSSNVGRWNSTVLSSPPCNNGTVSGNQCTCNTNFFDTGSSCVQNVNCSAPQVRDSSTNTCSTPPPPQESQQTCEAKGKILNSQTGNCDDPPKNCYQSEGKETIRRVQVADGCPVGKSDPAITECSSGMKPRPSFDCVDGCQYNRVEGASAIKGCYTTSPPDGTASCDYTFKGAGNSCSNVTISSGSTASTGNPINKTPLVNGELNATSSPSANNGNPSSGGGGTKGSPAANPSNSSPANPSQAQNPNTGTQQQANNSQGDVNCPGCATELTQQQVLKSVTDTQGGIAQPDFNSGLSTDDIRNRLTNNNRIQSFFTVDSPNFSSQCPTFTIEIPMFNRTYNFSLACSLIEPYQSTIRLISTLGWTVSAILMIMMA